MLTQGPLTVPSWEISCISWPAGVRCSSDTEPVPGPHWKCWTVKAPMCDPYPTSGELWGRCFLGSSEKRMLRGDWKGKCPVKGHRRAGLGKLGEWWDRYKSDLRKSLTRNLVGASYMVGAPSGSPHAEVSQKGVHVAQEHVRLRIPATPGY